MPITYIDAKNETLEINSYNGNFMQKEISQFEFNLKELLSPQRWNFFRQDTNHAYVGGSVFYEGDCKNNLIISPYINNQLTNVKNAFVFVGDSFIEVSPISDITNAIDKGKRTISNQEIKYNIPKTVFERENLIKKDLEKLTEDVRQKYRIEPKEIYIMNQKRGIYHIKSKNKKEYVLKFRGRNKEKTELLSRIAEDIPFYFPINFRRKDNGEFTFNSGEELYGLEEFITNLSPKVRNSRYFSLLGTHMGLLHKQFSSFIKKNREAEKLLIPTGECTSESNLISFYLDLLRDETKNRFLLSELENIIDKNLNNQIDSLPKELIHKDLNHSNLIWQKDNPKIIDSETIKNSIKLSEFEAPLLLEGNMQRPRYIRNSLNEIIHSYNQSSEVPLSEKEKMILPSLLKYSILRNFVIRKIRRREKDENYLDKTIENLKFINEDSL